ncbi:cathepsin d [Plakobranchus ocellatus]|uniref:Cathepsin d n=1 Tax=Plakobranchus ocellatus TaxID=259542 RepID=A0AAV3Y1Q3_9GAST|nr:cathepsin d [Plakobranchus ocellatus]
MEYNADTLHCSCYFLFNLFSENHQRYDNASSSTYKQDGSLFGVNYDYGEVAGYWSQDSITLGGSTVKNQTFGEAIVDTDLFADTGNDGVIGLGFRDISRGEAPTVFDNMVSQGVVPAPVFSFYLNRKNSNGPESTLTLGGTNSDLYTGDFLFVDLDEPGSWHFKMDRIQIANGGGTVCKEGCLGLADTGTSFITGPLEEVDFLNTQLGGKPLPTFPKMYVLDCSDLDSLPDVEFVVNGQKLTLTNKDYIVKINNDGETLCFSGFVGRSVYKNFSPVWVLGDVFIRAYYTQFDKGNSRIGFAKAKH